MTERKKKRKKRKKKRVKYSILAGKPANIIIMKTYKAQESVKKPLTALKFVTVLDYQDRVQRELAS